MKNKILIGFLAWIGYVLFALFLTFPAGFTQEPLLLGDGGDNREYASYIYIQNQRLLHSNNKPIFRYPHGFCFTCGHDAKLFVLLGAFLVEIVPLETAYNWLVIFFLSLNGLATYSLLRYLKNSYLISFFGGLIYGFSFYVYARIAGHPNLLQIWAIPLLFISLFEFRKNTNWTQLLFIFIALFAVFISSISYGLMSILVLVILFAYYRKAHYINLFITKPNSNHIIGFIIIGILYSLVLFDYGKLFLSQDFTLRANYEFPANLHTFFKPNIFLPNLITQVIITREEKPQIDTFFFGYIELFLLVFSISLLFRTEKNLIKIIAIFWILSLGHKIGEYFYLPFHFFAKLPFFSLLHEPDRLFVFYYLFITILICRFLSKYNFSKYLIIIYLVLAILERAAPAYYITENFEKPYMQVVANAPGEAVLDLPILIGSGESETAYNLLPRYYDKAIVGGYFHWLAVSKTSQEFFYSNPLLLKYFCRPTSEFSSVEKINNYDLNDAVGQTPADLFDRLRENGIRTIVLHKDLIEKSACISTKSDINFLLKQSALKRITETDSADVYSINNRL